MPERSWPERSNLLTSLLLIILPKCPFCILAYSSTLMLCSREETIISSRVHNSIFTISITAFFCLLTIIAIFLNYRDKRTKYALLLALAGSVSAIISTAYSGGLFLYYTGIVLIFLGIWLNGSMLFFINKIKNLFHKRFAAADLSIAENHL